MKNFVYVFTIASAIMLASACAKEIAPIDGPAEDERLTKCSIQLAVDPQMKISLDGTKTAWVAGDSIVLCQYGRYKASESETIKYYRDKTPNVFTARTSGESVIFDGSIANYHLRDTTGDATAYKDEKSGSNSFYMFYPARAIVNYTVSNSYSDIVIPNVQTGLFDDFTKNIIFNGGISEEGKTSYDPGTDHLIFTASTSLICVSPMLKFSVPEALGVTKIIIKGKDKDGKAIGISGKYTARASGLTKNFVAPVDSTITVYNGGSVISGTQYIVLAPSRMTDTRKTENEAKALEFTLVNSDGGEAVVNGSIKEGGNSFKSAVLSNLGSLPESVEFTYNPPTDLKFLDNTNPIVTLCDTLKGYSFYYTTGISTCDAPTTDSTRFYASQGFPVKTFKTDYSSSVFKILIHHDTHGEKVVSGLIRDWNFTSSSRIVSAVMDSIEVKASVIVDDITVSNMGTKKIGFKLPKTSYVELGSSTYFTLPVLNKAKVSALLCIASNNTGTRAFKLFKADAASASSGTVQPIISSASNAGKTICGKPVELGEMNGGDIFTIWHNGGSYISRYTVLESAEVLSNLPDSMAVYLKLSQLGLTTSSKSPWCGYRSFDVDGFTIGLDTVGDSENGTTYYYSTSNGLVFGLVGNPTAKTGYIVLPVLEGYKLAKVDFHTNKNNKTVYVKATKLSSTNLGSVKVPDPATSDMLTINVNDPGGLSAYYMGVNFSTTMSFKDITLTYAKFSAMTLSNESVGGVTPYQF